jgi:hypothetical protein
MAGGATKLKPSALGGGVAPAVQLATELKPYIPNGLDGGFIFQNVKRFLNK